MTSTPEDNDLPSVQYRSRLRRMGISASEMTRAKLWERFMRLGSMRGRPPVNMTTNQIAIALIGMLRVQAGRQAR